MNELLFEIGTEEIPAGYIAAALHFLAVTAEKRLSEFGLKYGAVKTFGTPRRLTLVIEDLDEKQETRSQEHIGPAKKVGFDAEGKPTKAAMGFARSRGVEVNDLQVVNTDKGEYLMAVEEVKGRKTASLLPEFFLSLIQEMPFPKSMRWGRGKLAFARPIQWILALFAGDVVDFSVEGVRSGNKTRGHRFMAPDFFQVQNSTEYLEGLQQHHVIVDPEQRKAMVVDTVGRAVDETEGIVNGRPYLDDALVETVTNLVEMPWGVCGRFDEKFLALPREALVTSMREHQKYFPVLDEDGALLPLFVAVNNTHVSDTKTAVNGHERVLRARLEDGLFFFNKDKEQSLADRLGRLSGIVFQKKLGTMAEKGERIARLAGILAEQLVPDHREDAVRAARLAKVDLLTEMVGEFPSLQGIIGGEYARLDGESEAVAIAVREHYMPVRAESAVPNTLVGAVVGLSDRLDTLVGCFAIGERPTGNKDSFGLRRQAIGLINIIRGLNISFSLEEMIREALAGYKEIVKQEPDVVAQVLDFIRRRFENELLSSGYNQGVIEAATTVGFDNVTDCLLRIEALDGIRSRDAFVVLSAAFKRIKNITKENVCADVQAELLQEEAEKELESVVRRVRAEVLPLIEKQKYDLALAVLLQMKEPVDKFFDEVMVMAEEEAVRCNRLNLLTALKDLVLQIGDISRMHAE